MYLTFFSPVVPWTVLIMILSCALTMDFRTMLQMKFSVKNNYLLLSIVFQVIMLFYFFASADGSRAQYYVYHFYVIFFIISLSSLKPKIDFSDLPFCLFLCSLIPSLLGAWLCYKGLVVGHLAWVNRQENASYVLEPFNVAQGALINQFSLMCLKMNSARIKKIVLVLFTAVNLYVLFVCNKRTPIFVLGVGLVLFLYWKNYISIKLNKKKIYTMAVVLLIAVFLFLFVPIIQEKVSDMSDNLIAGIQNLFGNSSVRDKTGSAIERFSSREYAYDFIQKKYDLYNYFFGGGYFVRWLDNPVLQAYLDMGIIGLFFYSYLILAYPFFLAFKKNQENELILAKLLCLYAILSVLNSGHPYMWIKYTPVCVLSVLYTYYKRNNKL